MTSYALQNYMEVCVKNMLPGIIGQMDICKCEKCVMDITAYALNQLKPKYVVTDEGNLFARVGTMNVQFDTDVITAITNGAKLVGSNPKHD